jgi:hypothetical protein
VTLHRLMPADVDAERLSDLLEDARAIPAAAFSVSTCAVRRVIDLTAVPAQRVAVQIPAATLSLALAAEHQWADFRR